MKYFIICGEPSGDLHGAHLMQALKDIDNAAQFRYWGGDAMEKQAPGLVKHIKNTAYMGVSEVARHLPEIISFFTEVKQDIFKFRPDVIVLIDYPGFNLRVAQWAKKRGFKVVYYISPKVWAWKASRIKKIEQYVDKLLVIFPFEVDIYAPYEIDVVYVGNPLQDAVQNYRPDTDFLVHNNVRKPIIALLPGSREQELNRLLYPMIKGTENFKDKYEIVIAATSNVAADLYPSGTKTVYDQTYDLLHHAHMAVVASGTATLEAALFDVPQVVVYKTGMLTYQLGKRFVNLDHISLVNILAGRTVVTELIQHECNELNIEREVLQLMAHRHRILDDYAQIKTTLKVDKSPSHLAAMEVIETVKN